MENLIRIDQKMCLYFTKKKILNIEIEKNGRMQTFF